MEKSKHICWFEDINLSDLPLVGGKNASLGEMTQSLSGAGVTVPPGFAVTAELYREFIYRNQLEEAVEQELSAFNNGTKNLAQIGERIRSLILAGAFSEEQINIISAAYQELEERTGQRNISIAVRSSATAEDLPEASFAGQQESYLNVIGAEALLLACQQCFASLYTDRAIVYRQEQGFDKQPIALSVGVQQMVRSDKGSAGVMFTLDTETGFPDAILITGAWGLGESVVKGSVNPDRFMVFKPLLDDASFTPIIEKTCGSKLVKMTYQHVSDCASIADQVAASTQVLDTSKAEQVSLVLSNEEVMQLAQWGLAIERHYGRPMDIEWAKDGITGNLFIVQARAETIESRKDHAVLETYTLKEKSEVLVEGSSVGSAIVNGKVCYLKDPVDSEQFIDGAILVTERTDPDWVPVMRRAAGIVTNTGGPTSHAAIVSRELKVPAIVGAAGATDCLLEGMDITMDCSSGALAKVYSGCLDFQTKDIHLDEIPATKTDLMINVAMPDGAMRWWPLPVAGIGLTRIEFIISSQIRVHPMALLHPEKIDDRKLQNQIKTLTAGFDDPVQFFVETLALGVGKIAASQHPNPVIVRCSDFKTNEYRGLLGGEFFEPEEENPMLGLRGASRYYHPRYREAFLLECQAIKYVREKMGLKNVIVMIPFCRTPKEAKDVLAVMAEAGLQRGVDGLQVYVMCEIPSNVILAEQFAQYVDGFSIGSNDLTQLVLGVDRDSAELNYLFDARDEAVKRMISQVIKVAHENNVKVGICGQAPSDHPEFAEFLVKCGIDSISLNPDSIVQAARHVKAAEDKNNDT